MGVGGLHFGPVTRGGNFLKYPLPGRGKFFICLNCLKIIDPPLGINNEQSPVEVSDLHAPLRSKRVHGSKSPWITTELKKMMHLRDRLK